MGVTPGRAAEVDLSPPFLQFDYTFLVPAGSSIRNAADADRPGIRIAVVRNHVSTLALSRLLENAKQVEADTPDAAFDLLRSGRAARRQYFPRKPTFLHESQSRSSGQNPALRG
jgi:polar amino acid transport system substrate-binding protein